MNEYRTISYNVFLNLQIKTKYQNGNAGTNCTENDDPMNESLGDLDDLEDEEDQQELQVHLLMTIFFRFTIENINFRMWPRMWLL